MGRASSWELQLQLADQAQDTYHRPEGNISERLLPGFSVWAKIWYLSSGHGQFLNTRSAAVNVIIV